jgi:hypothetical protein
LSRFSPASPLQRVENVQDTRPVENDINDVLPLCPHAWAPCAYLERSIRHNATLATLDYKLQNAAKSAGIKIFEGGSGMSMPPEERPQLPLPDSPNCLPHHRQQTDLNGR